MPPSLLLPLAAVALALLALLALLAFRAMTAGLARSLQQLRQDQTQLAGSLAHLHVTVDARLANAARQLSDGVSHQSRRTDEALAQIRERLAVVDAAQKNLADLSEQMVGLQDILSNKQQRGVFGEVQLEDLVRSCLPPSAYAFQVTLGNRRRADCLLKLPNPPGAIVVDAKFPLESYRALRAARDAAAARQAGRAFADAVRDHIAAIAERYIVPGETAESALLFLPSESVYAELHASFPAVVEEGYRARVWIVSPTTLMATLHTVRAVLKDARMREAAGQIQQEVHLLLDDVRRLDERAAKVATHFAQAQEDVRQVQLSTQSVLRRGARIEAVEIGDADATANAPVPARCPDSRGKLSAG